MCIIDTLSLRKVKSVTEIFYAMWIIIIIVFVEESESVSFLVHKYSTRIVKTKYGPLRGIIIHMHPSVEAFLGVPYATPPVGSLRYMPPVTPSMWKSTRLADRFSAVCPQRLPDIGNRSEALLEYPKNRLLYLEKVLPLLANQSEDCLYLNLYVPRTVTGGEETSLLPCIVYVHGESYEWSSGNLYDGTILASTGRVIVVTINFRLGVLGFLKTGAKNSAQGNFGLMDLVAGLHWLRENLPAFGGDPQKVTLMGHGTGAALVNFIAISPVAKELLHRVILLSGSSLSPWALQKDPLWVKRSVSLHTRCYGDLLEDDLAPCLRLQPLNHLLDIRLDIPRFLPGFAPFVDGTVLINPTATPPNMGAPTISTSQGFELADFPDRALLFGLTSTESYLDLNAQDLEFGFNETKRDRILRTYVRNAYYYHLNEIFSTLKNEYTDWEKPSQNPLSVRDATLDVLSDGHTAAPLIRIGYLHSLKGGTTFFFHFQHHNGERDVPMRFGSVRGDDLPYALGFPLTGAGFYSPYNYTFSDAAISKALIYYISNFVKTGNPNGELPNISVNLNSLTEKQTPNFPFWDTYDTINQFYLEIGNHLEKKDHYRGHKMSLWLNLIPQLHRPGDGGDVSMRHHQFQEEDDQYYDGYVRPQIKEKPTYIHLSTASTSISTESTSSTPIPPKSDTALQATTTECPPNQTIFLPSQTKTSNNLLRKLASSHYQNYTTALTITIAVGCFLLLLNVLIFAGIYHQRDREKNKRKRKEAQHETGSCSSSSGEGYDKSYEIQHSEMKCSRHKYGSDFSCNQKMHTDIQITELPIQNFKSSPPPAKRIENIQSSFHPPDVTTTSQDVLLGRNMTSSSPVVEVVPPASTNQIGILRPQGGPVTPGTMKKRVQIQEISV
ncbi:neuroligin-1-like [Diabrotica undecimpunctata]|uniref:neuroligin-1-like n=1 Tax=Diabrotica undecimpunctata TaxID=50387 RepID=UPI003B6358C6